MNSSKSTPSKLLDDANGIGAMAIDDPFDGESTGIRPRTRKHLPLASDALCEEVSRLEDEPPSDYVLPTWEELTGMRSRVTTTRTFGAPSSGRQQAIDLVEAEQRRRSTMPPGVRGDQRALSSSWRSEGSPTSQPADPPLPWVDRFERDTNARLEAPEHEEADQIAELEERFADSGRPTAALPVPVPPPPPVSTLRSQLPAPPPSSRPSSRPHVPSSFPANRPLPRFALGPRMEGLLGPERRPMTATAPGSLAPLATHDIRLQPRMNPWAAGVLGALMSAAAGFAFFWSPPPESTSANLAAAAYEEALDAAEERVRPFEQEAAQQLANGAAENARACGMGKVPTEVGVAFAPDGTVMSVEARGEGRLSEDTAYCMDDSFSNLRIPPFDGKAREVRLTLR